MSIFANIRSAARLAWGLRSLVRHPFTLEQCVQMVRERLARREDHFLDNVERLIFRHPASPYRLLFDLAGCELGDVAAILRTDGLDGTLERLREAGIYLTYEEFKGKKETVRGGKTFLFHESDFNNPLVRATVTARSGGTVGPSTSSPMDLQFTAYLSTKKALIFAAHGILGVPEAMWIPVLPDTTALKYLLYGSKIGLAPPERWFSPTEPVRSPLPALGLSGLAGFLLLGRLLGRSFPVPQHVPVDRPEHVARWVSATVARSGAALLRTRVSLALEVVKAAQREHLDLDGAIFYVGGEPLTDTRAEELASSGARLLQAYGISEMGGGVAGSCASPSRPDDMHLFTDQVALIRHHREHNGMIVEPFLYTSLHSLAPKVMLNVETDDCGEVEQRTCGCFLEEVGLTTHIHHVRSFSKLTTQGMNVLGIDLLRILEQVLPARFGGSSVDYQLVEEEQEDGTVRLSLLINPEVGQVDIPEVVATFLSALREGRPAYQLAADVWQQAATLTVSRQRPIATWRGKIMPLHFASSRPRA